MSSAVNSSSPSGGSRLLLLLVPLGLFALSGAACPGNLVRQYTAPMPRALPPSPTLEQVIEVVNRNNDQIHGFSTNRATLTGPGFPTLRASIAMERPRRFRLRAETGLTGPEVDLGSNDELFWFWIRRNEPPAVYYCRHDQFATSSVRHQVPIAPDWLIEALGLTRLDPNLPHQGPLARADGKLEIRTIRETAEGPTTKITVVDPFYGWVMEQAVLDARGRLVASAVASGHRRDPLTGLTMPRAVHISCPLAQFSMRIDLGSVAINHVMGDRQSLWAMPRYDGYPVVDLCAPGAPSRPGVPLTSWNRR